MASMQDPSITRNPFISPRLWAFDYLGLWSSRLLLEKLLHTELGGARDLTMLDVGCGTSPWRAPFLPYVKEHVGLDMRSGPHVDVVASATNMPFSDSSFDIVFSMSVLEHIRKHQEAVREMHRVLKPGGLLIAGVPFIWEIHGHPHDYLRWTPSGLQETLSTFASCRVAQIGGPLINYLLIRNIYWRALQVRWHHARVLFSPVILANNVIGKIFGRHSSPTNMAAFYIATARK